MSDLPSIVAEIRWMTDALQAGFEPGQPVDSELLDTLVEHLRNVTSLAELIECELAASRNLIADIEKRTRATAASFHPEHGSRQ